MAKIKAKSGCYMSSSSASVILSKPEWVDQPLRPPKPFPMELFGILIPLIMLLLLVLLKVLLLLLFVLPEIYVVPAWLLLKTLLSLAKDSP